MPNYRETKEQVEKAEWLRSFKVLIENTFGKLSCITYFEELLQTINGVVNKRTEGRILKEDFTNPMATFPKLNPETDEVIGEYTNMDLYLIHYAKYKALAKADDERFGKNA